MKLAFIIAADEWRYWRRSKLATAAALLAFILIFISLFSTSAYVSAEKNTRVSLQQTAEETFRNQPARHPHRMVHYGHYVFRAPTPLASLDPGVDSYTGTVMFLEGHRQNSATFSSSFDGAKAGAFAQLTPALSYQLLLPLILIIIGFACVSREREAGTDQQLLTTGISTTTLWLGKTIALLAAAGLALLPLIIGALLSGSNAIAAFGFSTIYALYLFAWVLCITAVSAWSKRGATSLLVLVTLWLCFCILTPRLLASFSNAQLPNASQIESDMAVVEALRSVGDGHNANDPAFSKLRENLLKEYEVDDIKDLPFNFRGLVAQTAEAELTQVLNKYAEDRMNKQTEQIRLMRSFEFLSPYSVLQSASMLIAGTDLRTHHRFLDQAEATRFEFVQGLNEVHKNQLSYHADINRSKDQASERRTRMSADNWRILKDFKFEPFDAQNRLSLMLPSVLLLSLWILLIGLFGYLGSRSLSEVSNG